MLLGPRPNEDVLLDTWKEGLKEIVLLWHLFSSSLIHPRWLVKMSNASIFSFPLLYPSPLPPFSILADSFEINLIHDKEADK